MKLEKGKPMSVAECNAFQQKLARQRIEESSADIDDLLGGFDIEDNRVVKRTVKKKVAARRR